MLEEGFGKKVALLKSHFIVIGEGQIKIYDSAKDKVDP